MIVQIQRSMLSIWDVNIYTKSQRQGRVLATMPTHKELPPKGRLKGLGEMKRPLWMHRRKTPLWLKIALVPVFLLASVAAIALLGTFTSAVAPTVSAGIDALAEVDLGDVVESIQAPTNSETLNGKVVGITDGDTLTLLVGRTQHKIRLGETDTPERGQDWGRRAKSGIERKGWW